MRRSEDGDLGFGEEEYEYGWYGVGQTTTTTTNFLSFFLSSLTRWKELEVQIRCPVFREG